MNSGICALQRPAATTSLAMVLMGFDLMRSLVLSASMYDLFDPRIKSLEGLWDHSTGSAKIANALAIRLHVSDPEQYAVAGLLHDIGVVAIAHVFPAEVPKIRALVAERGVMVVDAEREVLGFTHGDAGLWLMQQWGLPSQLVAPIGFHHDFDVETEHSFRTAVVHVADILSRAKGLGNAGDRLMPTMNPAAWELLGLTMDDLRDVMVQVDAELKPLARC